jgi:hypothetical protein
MRDKLALMSRATTAVGFGLSYCGGTLVSINVCSGVVLSVHGHPAGGYTFAFSERIYQKPISSLVSSGAY